MAAQFVLQVKHVLCQLMTCDFIRFLHSPVLADLVVLAIDTAQITVSKKDGARTLFAGENRLLAVMVAVRGNNRQCPGIAVSHFTAEAINPAFSRADIAVSQPLFKPLGALCHFARFIKGNIYGNHENTLIS